MNLASHVALTAPVAAVIAWKAGVNPAACFCCGAVLIDIDHFIFYSLRTGRYNPIEMFAWFRNNDKRCTAASYQGLNIFHAAETFMLISIASTFFPILSWLLLGMGFHMILDYLWIGSHPVLGLKVRALSWTEHFVRKGKGEREFWRERGDCE